MAKRGAAVPLSRELRPRLASTMWPGPRSTSVPYQIKQRLHPSSQLATIDMGQKLSGGGCALFLGVAGSTNGRPKTVCPMLSDRCLSVCLYVCLSVCDVGVLWPNGWMHQDETWHAGRPRPWSHCVRWGSSSPSPKRGRAPNLRPISVVVKWLDRSRCHLVGK